MNLVLLIKENALLGALYRGLSALVEVVPYQLYREYPAATAGLSLKPKLDGFDVLFLDPVEAVALARHPEVPESADVLHARIEDGCLCLALKVEGRVVAYTWCNLRKCDYDGRLDFPLKDDEAYLFDARTFQACRGRSVAPFLRDQMYRKLADMGRSRLFSTTSCFNSSARRFKEKLRAKPVRLYVYIGLLGRFRINIFIRRYRSTDAPA